MIYLIESNNSKVTSVEAFEETDEGSFDARIAMIEILNRRSYRINIDEAMRKDY